MSIGWQATRIAIPGYVVPFMAVYDPALMMQGDSWTDVIYMVFKATVAIGLWGAAMIGFLKVPLNWPERIIAAAAAFLLILAVPISDSAGFALGVIFLAWHLWTARTRSADAPA